MLGLIHIFFRESWEFPQISNFKRSESQFNIQHSRWNLIVFFPHIFKYYANKFFRQNRQFWIAIYLTHYDLSSRSWQPWPCPIQIINQGRNWIYITNRAYFLTKHRSCFNLVWTAVFEWYYYYFKYITSKSTQCHRYARHGVHFIFKSEHAWSSVLYSICCVQYVLSYIPFLKKNTTCTWGCFWPLLGWISKHGNKTLWIYILLWTLWSTTTLRCYNFSVSSGLVMTSWM